jgi:hypothetical protein
MTPYRIFETPARYLRTLQAYHMGFETDRVKLNDLVQSNLRLLDTGTYAVNTDAWRGRLEDLRSKVEAATAEPVGPTLHRVLRELETLSANSETNVPSELQQRYSSAIAQYQLRAADMSELIRELLDLNNQIASSLDRDNEPSD